MQLLLLQDVAGVGKKNDIVIVGDGFALNCLLPQRMALVATPVVRKRFADQIRRRAEEKEKERKLQQQVAEVLLGRSIRLARKASKTGKLYAAVSADQISEALAEQHQVTIAPDGVILNEPIKSLGTFSVQLKFGSGTHNLPVTVVAEEAKK